MSYNIQVDGVNEQRTIIISEINPQLEYDLLPTAVSYSSGPDTTAITVANTNGNIVAGCMVLLLNGSERGRCWTISARTASIITVYGDAEDSIFTTPTYWNIAVVHSASTMYDYCVTNEKECIAVTCESLPFMDGSPENPESYADHITMRIGTGVYEQSVQFTNCSVWRTSPLDRVWRMNQIRSLLFKWHELNNNTAVYLIVTIEHYADSRTYRQNWDWFDVGDDGDADTFGRGYLKGFPMKVQGTQEYSPEFTLQFKEAWLL